MPSKFPRRPRFVAFTLFLAAVLFPQVARSDDYSWNNTSGGNWNVGSSWDKTGGGNGVPGAADNALIEVAGTYTVSLTDNRSISSLTVNNSTATLSHTAGIFTVGSAFNLTAGTYSVTNAGTFTLNGSMTSGADSTFNLNGGAAEWNGTGSAILGGAFNWTDGIIEGSGSVTLNGAATFAGGADKGLRGSKVLVVAGGGTWSGGRILIDTGTTFRIASGSVLTNTDNTQLWWSSTSTAHGVFDLQGTFSKTGGTGLTEILDTTFTLASTGTLSVQSGAVRVAGNATYNGTVSLGSGGTLRLTNGVTISTDQTHTFNSGATLDLSAGTVEVLGATINAAVDFSPNVLTINRSNSGSAVVNLNGANNAVGTLNLQESGSGVGTATLAGSGNVTVGGGGFNWSVGVVEGSGTMTVNGPVNLSGGVKQLRGSRTLIVAGGGTWSGGEIQINGGTTFRINVGSVLTNTGDTILQDNFTAGGTFDIQGTFRKTTATGTTTWQDGPVYDVSGTVDIQAGTLTIANAANLVNFSGGTLTKGTWRTQNGTLNFGSRTISTIAAPATVIFDGASSTFAALDSLTTNNGTLRVLGGKTFTPAAASITNAGTLEVGDGSTFAKAVVVASGGTLTGNGTVAGVTAQSSGTVAPGGSAGILTVNGDATLESGSIFSVELNGTNAGTEYDRLVVSGNVNLNGSILTGFLNYTPAPTDQLFIIVNNGANPIGGTFASGSTITLGAYTATISYEGDLDTLATTGGNDVVLHSFQPVPEPGAILAIAAMVGLVAALRRRWLVGRAVA